MATTTAQITLTSTDIADNALSISNTMTITTAGTETGITETENNVTGITTTNETGSNTAHNTMHPFLVLNYIILAKHPSF